uniref:Uncharacterized protein n=1 Tax=Nelumbo nucifera TaxID=4432 RepID=A0A822Z6J8_NELNU|nr:TPA_asm: hypothetical protein HUJ06_013418 [Nelumbo nucifera]
MVGVKHEDLIRSSELLTDGFWCKVCKGSTEVEEGDGGGALVVYRWWRRVDRNLRVQRHAAEANGNGSENGNKTVIFPKTEIIRRKGAGGMSLAKAVKNLQRKGGY